MTRKFKIAAKAAKEIGSLYNTIATSEILLRDNLARPTYDAEAGNRAITRARNAARTLLTEYGIVAIGYFKHEDLEDYRRGLLNFDEPKTDDSIEPPVECETYLSRSNGMWTVIHRGMPICANTRRRYEAERAAEQLLTVTPNQRWYWNGDDGRWALLSSL